MNLFTEALAASTTNARAAHQSAAGAHGYNFAALPEGERTGYAKAMMDMIDWLTRQSESEPNAIVAAGLRVAAQELRVYRNVRLNAELL